MQVDLRRQWISQMVEEVQKVVHHLTTEISYQDFRFQAIPYCDTYNENIKVSRSLGSKCPPSEPGNGWVVSVCVRHSHHQEYQ